MANRKVIDSIQCNTVGDLLDHLAALAKDPNRSDLMDATIEGADGETYTGFRIIEHTLSDKSVALDFELFGD